ncbi:MAG: outer membrane beta-barrel protein [Bacteroidaceae bacterium]|nr:outer membrane beta-barrel protein [Bacteroidaceae bacterium]
MKKIIFTFLFALVGMSSAFAQFEKGKYYLAATTNSGGFSYSKTHKARFNLGVNGGYMFEEAWMAIADMGFDYHNSDMQTFYVGGKLRYLIEQNGIFLQAGAKYVHGAPNFNDVQITPEVGYCFFLNRHLTLEPSLYYDVSLSDFSDKSEFGVKIGLAWYFDNDKKPSDYVKRRRTK